RDLTFLLRPPEATLIEAVFLHGLEKKTRTASHGLLRARPDSESYPAAPRPLKEPNVPLLYGWARPAKSPYGYGCSRKLTLCLPQRTGQLRFSTVHVSGSVWAEKISLELNNLNNVHLMTFVYVCVEKPRYSKR
ncbi:hypothetical protein AMECASPLE_023349, partial [Ameca splendens]